MDSAGCSTATSESQGAPRGSGGSSWFARVVVALAMSAGLVALSGNDRALGAEKQPAARVVPNAGISRADHEPLGEREPAGAGGVQHPIDGGGLAGLVQPDQMVSPGGLSSTLNLLILLTVLSLAPSAFIMTTCFIRFIIVMGLLRQALGTQQLPPNQVLISLCLFMTFMVMAPVWHESYEQGIRPYTNPAPDRVPISPAQAFEDAVRPVRRFMSEQIERTGNSDTVWMFLEHQRPDADAPGANAYRPPETYAEVPLSVLLPSYMLSELKTAFIIGFQLYLPFLVIDMVVSSVLMSMGMMMLPPTLISFPFKLLLFVLIDGWALTVGMLLDSIKPFA